VARSVRGPKAHAREGTSWSNGLVGAASGGANRAIGQFLDNNKNFCLFNKIENSLKRNCLNLYYFYGRTIFLSPTTTLN
jgi:hypothetical protein